MNWIILILAGLMEVGFTFCLGKTKTATGQELTMWWIGFLTALALSMYLMAKAAEKLPIGTVYPVWTGIGAVGAVVPVQRWLVRSQLLPPTRATNSFTVAISDFFIAVLF